MKEGSAKGVGVKISGSGYIDCRGLMADEADAKISGSGSVYIGAKESLEAKISGSGNVYYSGNPKNVEAKVAGSGKVVKQKA